MSNKKVSLIVVIGAMLFSAQVFASTVGPEAKLTWDYEDPLPDNVDGFRLYCADVPVWEGVGRIVMLSNTSMPVGRQDCHVVAYNAAGESDASNVVEVKYVTGKPVKPDNLRVQP